MTLESGKSDYIWTSIAMAWTVLMNAIVYNLLVRTIGEVGFSEYVIGRRALSFMTVLLFLGVGVALPRQLAMSREWGRAELGYFLGAAVLIVPGLFLTSAAISFLPGQFSLYLFGEPGHENLVTALVVFLWASVVNALIYSFFRGLLRFKDAAALVGVTATAVPAAVLISDSASDIFFIAAVFTMLANAIFFLYVSKRIRNTWKETLRTARSETRPLANYGIPRVPGDLALQALFVAPILLANYAYSISIGSYIAFALVFIGLANTVLSPISFVLLPRTTVILRDRGFAGAEKEIQTILVGTLVLSALAALVIYFSAEFIIFSYLSIEDVRAVAILRIVSLSIVPYAVYSVLRSVIDAAEKRPLNAHNLYYSFGGFLLVAILSLVVSGDDFPLFITAIPISFCILGFTSYWTLRRIAKAMP